MQEDRSRPLVLITGHRRESFGDGFENICQAVLELADRFPDAVFVYPVHLNPRVRQPVFEPSPAAAMSTLLDPLAYLPIRGAVMDRSRLLLTDSGGVREESRLWASRSSSCGIPRSGPRRSRRVLPGWSGPTGSGLSTKSPLS